MTVLVILGSGEYSDLVSVGLVLVLPESAHITCFSSVSSRDGVGSRDLQGDDGKL